jgi:hypothetical protein
LQARVLTRPGCADALPGDRVRATAVWESLARSNRLIQETFSELHASAAADPAEFTRVVFRLSTLPSSFWSAGHEEVSGIVSRLLRLRDGFAEVSSRLTAAKPACVLMPTRTRQAQDLLRGMGEGAGVPILPDSQAELAQATAALPGVLAAGVPGAGVFPSFALAHKTWLCTER